MNASLVPQQFFRYLGVFRLFAGYRLLFLTALMLASSYAEGLGIALFLPIFSSGQGVAAAQAGGFLRSFFTLLHVPMTPLGVLPAIVVLFTAKGVLQFAANTYQYHLSARLTRSLRQRLIDGVGAADYRYIVGTNTGFLANLFSNEVNRAALGFVYYSRSLTPLFSIAVFLVIILFIDYRMTLLCVVIGMVLLALLRAPARVVKRLSDQTAAENAALTTLLIQAVQGFKYLLATAGFSRFHERIHGAAAELERHEFKSGAVYSAVTSMSQPLMVLCLAGILYYRVRVSGGSLGSMFVLLVYLYRVMAETFLLQAYWQQFVMLAGSVDVVERAVADVEGHREAGGTQPYAGLREAIACTRLDFAYQAERPVLRGLELRIPRCTTVGFVGESGSGKSTLVDLLLGTLKPTGGTVTIDGHDLATLDLAAFRRTVGYVPQESVLFDDTVANNICLWSRDAHTAEARARIHDAATRARSAEFIAALPGGYDAVIGDRGVKLSGGQRQRLAIARELFKRPEILVLDEATSALDSESEEAIQASIDALKGQMTILIIAHRLSTLRRCDRLYVLHEGRIAEVGGYEELLARPGSLFRRMCELQRLVGSDGNG